MVLSCNALQALSALIQHSQKLIRKEAAWVLSNIAAGSPEQIDALCRQNLLPLIIHALDKDDFEVQREAGWFLNNMVIGGRPEHARLIVDKGGIPPLLHMLTLPDTKLILLSLETIEGILQHGLSLPQSIGSSNSSIYCDIIETSGGLELIEQLQDHPNSDVYVKAQFLLKTFFVPNVVGGGELFQNFFESHFLLCFLLKTNQTVDLSVQPARIELS